MAIQSLPLLLSANQDIERFFAKADCTAECWEWQGAKDRKGYGYFQDKKVYRAHRWLYRQIHPEVNLKGLVIRHSCDNPSCVNPDHLLHGSHQDNMNDMVARGRQASGDRNGMRLHPESLHRGDEHWTHRLPERVARGDQQGLRLHPECRARGLRNGKYTKPEATPRGEQNGSAKLTEADIPVIFALRRAGCTQRQIAKIFGVTKYPIQAVLQRKTWAHVPI